MTNYQLNTKLNRNEWITDPRVPEPENLPQPIGWTLLIRPYPIQQKSKGGIILTSESVDFANYLTNVGRVVSVAPCCWNRNEHRNKQGEQFDWVEVGDFVEYASHTGLKRKFKGVSFIVLMDDEIITKLPDPLVYTNEQGGFDIDIPEEDLKKYNTIHNPNYKGNK